MDAAQRVLFHPFPRAIGTNGRTGQIHQWTVHSEGEFDIFFDSVNGVKNVYASISWRPIGGTLRLDKIAYDFDTPQKEGDDGWPVFGGEEPPQDEVVARMRNDEYVADEVLAPVLDDAQRLIRRSQDDGIPIFCVFSGLGLHVYQMYQEKENPDKQVDTTAKKYVRELNLPTSDSKVHEVKRIMRVPNAQRMHLEMDDGEMVGSRPTSIYTIPLLPEEVLDSTASELLEMATEPRPMTETDLRYLHRDNRPEMQTHEDYLDNVSVEDTSQEDMRKLESPTNDDDDFLSYLLRDWLRMPCMYQRIQQPEPDHSVRRNCAVILFNIGLKPGEVLDLFSRIGWTDWNRQITRKQLKQIYNHGYSDMSCQTIRADGFCTRADDPHSCPTFGWSHGRAEWKGEWR